MKNKNTLSNDKMVKDKQDNFESAMKSILAHESQRVDCGYKQLPTDKCDELTKLAKPIHDWLLKNCDPMTIVLIEFGRVSVFSSEVERHLDVGN